MTNKIRLTLPFTTIVAAAFCLAAAVQAQEPMTNAQYGASDAGRKGDKALEGTNLKKGEAADSKKNEKNEASLSSQDKSFMKAAAKGGMMEVEMGKMAEQQGKSADVKKIGKRMVGDHSKANKELMAIAAKKGVDLPKEAPKMEKMGADFDKEYISMMVKDHEKDAAEFAAEAKDGSDPDVKNFAGKTLEVIKKHLAMVKDEQGKMK